MSRSVSSTPYENAAARVPPPENARTTSVALSSAVSDKRSTRYGLLASNFSIGGLTGRVAHPASSAVRMSSVASARSGRGEVVAG